MAMAAERGRRHPRTSSWKPLAHHDDGPHHYSVLCRDQTRLPKATRGGKPLSIERCAGPARSPQRLGQSRSPQPRPLELAVELLVLEQEQAALARDKAVAVNNRIQAQRYKKLLEEGIVPAQQVESMASAADAADAVVASDGQDG